MTFKDSASQFQIVDVSMIEADSKHARQNIDEDSLKGLTNSIRKMGVIHPLIVAPANAAGRYTVIVGERRRQASILAGEKTVPVIIRACPPDETLEVQVFENIGLGVRSALEPRDMANAIQKIAERFETSDQAANHFGRPPTWLTQATAAANLSQKVTALLDAGKISSTGTAVRLEKLARKNEAKADSLIDQIEQLPEGEKVSKKLVDHALLEESGRHKKNAENIPVAAEVASVTSASPQYASDNAVLPPWETAPALGAPATAVAARSRVNPGKVKRVAEILGLADGDEEEVLVRLIDEFLALNQA